MILILNVKHYYLNADPDNQHNKVGRLVERCRVKHGWVEPEAVLTRWHDIVLGLTKWCAIFVHITCNLISFDQDQAKLSIIIFIYWCNSFHIYIYIYIKCWQCTKLWFHKIPEIRHVCVVQISRKLIFILMICIMPACMIQMFTFTT